MRRTTRALIGAGAVIAGAIAGLVGMAQAFSPVAVFGTLVPKDGNVALERDIAYGPDPRQKLDIYRPATRARGLPVLYFAYGGGWNSGEKADYGFVGHAFASRGYVTVIADYRLVPEVTYPTFVEDGAAAVRWTLDHIARYGGDPERLFVMGHSAGAYNVAMLALDPRFGVASDIDGLVGISGPYDFYPFDVAASQNAFGGSPDPEATQPVNLAATGAPPTLLLHGENDNTVAPRNSVALAEHLTAGGAEAALKIYPGANHADTLIAMSLPLRWRYPVFEDALAFLAEHARPGR